MNAISILFYFMLSSSSFWLPSAVTTSFSAFLFSSHPLVSYSELFWAFFLYVPTIWFFVFPWKLLCWALSTAFPVLGLFFWSIHPGVSSSDLFNTQVSHAYVTAGLNTARACKFLFSFFWRQICVSQVISGFQITFPYSCSQLISFVPVFFH